MIHDDRAEFSAIIDDTWAAFDRDPRPGVKEKFWEILNKFPIRTVRLAFDRWIESEQRVPTPAAIKQLAFGIRRSEKDGSARATDTAHEAPPSPWLPLCWTTAIAIGVTNPDVTISNQSPPSAQRFERYIRQIAGQLEQEFGRNDRGHPEETAIRKRVAAKCRDYAKENGFSLHPKRDLAQALLRRIQAS